jgi:hypothetical protein
MTKAQNDRTRPGPVAPLTAERHLLLQLMAQGMSNSQAGRAVGINRRTGTRWRYGRTIPRLCRAAAFLLADHHQARRHLGPIPIRD